MSVIEQWQVRIRGLVQGVGFRPMIWRLAKQAGLRGEVLNDSKGVLIRLACNQYMLDKFLEGIHREAPRLSRIDAVEVALLREELNTDAFTIIPSQPGDAQTAVAPDAATCEECLRDMRDPKNRRFGYAFTNCTDCGPRLSIVSAIPYDRSNTSMASFEMCPECRSEYEDPANRRFHAQPNACPTCGPQLWFLDREGEPLPADPIDSAVNALKAGKIIAVKGIGGFQLACDATSDNAVKALRERKRRRSKPFALMARDVQQVARFARLNAVSEAALRGSQAPIVLIPKPSGGLEIAASVAPDQTRLGFMLPSAPLHHLLLERMGAPLVMTSGNFTEEPQIIDNGDALSRLSAIADFFLLHDRDIVNRVDDSVIQIVDGEPLSLRRARGHAPEPITLHPGFSNAPPVLATGADLKNTFCLLKDGQAVVSQHIGDMANDRAHRDFRTSLSLLSRIFDFEPATVAIDSHPAYFSARIGREIALERNAELVEVQHHHAHIASAMAEHGLGPDAPKVLGVVLDGLGHGTDGTIWGGEFLLADYLGFSRLAHFKPVAMPGGDKASYQPWRNTFAHLQAVLGPDPLAEVERRFGDLPLLSNLRKKPIETLEQMIVRGLNAPLASSAGRLFDAVAGALAISFDRIEFEGEAAMGLQALAETRPDETGEYPMNTGTVVGWDGLWSGLLSDLRSGEDPAVIASRVHNSLASVIARQTVELSAGCGSATVVLSGGVFQNGLLLSMVQHKLSAKGLIVLIPRDFPANDGGISLGQAVIGAARTLTR